jgi:hypothetical protein
LGLSGDKDKGPRLIIQGGPFYLMTAAKYARKILFLRSSMGAIKPNALSELAVVDSAR